MILSLINISYAAKNEKVAKDKPLQTKAELEKKQSVATENQKNNQKTKSVQAPSKTIAHPKKHELSADEKRKIDEKIKFEQEYLKKEKAKDYKPSPTKDAGIIKCYEENIKKVEQIQKTHQAKTDEQKRKDVKKFYDEIADANDEKYKCFDKYLVKRNYRDQIIDNYKKKQEQKTEASK